MPSKADTQVKNWKGAEGTAIDYEIPACQAREIKGIVLLPHEFRVKILNNFRLSHGTDELVKLFSQFIGMANSVIENNREMAELVLITEGEMNPREAEKINLPTLFGALSGIELADKVDQSKICEGCAFRKGTCANQSPATTIDADWAAEGDAKFMCHLDLDDHLEPTHKCFGYAQIEAKNKLTL